MKKRETIFLLCDLVRIYGDVDGNICRSFGFRYKEVVLFAEEGCYLISGDSFEDLEEEDGFRRFGKYIIIKGHSEEDRAEFFIEEVIWETDKLLEYLLDW